MYIEAGEGVERSLGVVVVFKVDGSAVHWLLKEEEGFVLRVPDRF